MDTGGWEPYPGDTAHASRSLAEQVTAQARLSVEAADAVLFVVDAVVGITDADEAVAAVLRRSGKPVVLAANKVDDAPGEPAAAALWSLGLGEPHPVKGAARGGAGGDLLTWCSRRCRNLRAGAGRPRGRAVLIGLPNAGKSSSGTGWPGSSVGG